MRYFTIFQDKLHWVNIQDDQSWALRPASSHFYSASCRCGQVCEWTLIELYFNIIANLLFFFFCYLMVSVITMCNLIKRLIRATFWVLLQAMFMNDENKRHGQAIKIARETTINQKKRYNSVKHLQRQQFSFTKTSIKVSLKILSL